MKQTSGNKNHRTQANDRATRLKSALKANIARRKAQAHARDQAHAREDAGTSAALANSLPGEAPGDGGPQQALRYENATADNNNDNGQEQSDGFDSGKG